MTFTKNTKLILGIGLDLIGMASLAVPVLGAISDIVWAPVSGYMMQAMYKGERGKVAAIIQTIEELLPIDFIPTFTLMWMYHYVINPVKPEVETVALKS